MFIGLLLGNLVIAQTPLTDEPVGFASLDGGTTGGLGGKEMILTEAQQLVDIMKLREKILRIP